MVISVSSVQPIMIANRALVILAAPCVLRLFVTVQITEPPANQNTFHAQSVGRHRRSLLRSPISPPQSYCQDVACSSRKGRGKRTAVRALHLDPGYERILQTSGCLCVELRLLRAELSLVVIPPWRSSFLISSCILRVVPDLRLGHLSTGTANPFVFLIGRTVF